MEIVYKLRVTDLPNTIFEFKSSSVDMKRRSSAHKRILIAYAVLFLLNILLFNGDPVLQDIFIVLTAIFIINFIFGQYFFFILIIIGVLVTRLNHDNKSLSLNTSEISYQSKKSSFSIRYSDICKAEESCSYFRLWFEKGKKYILLPKREINDLDAIYTLLKENLSVKLEKF